MLSLLPPGSRSVLDVGCNDMHLATLLPAGATYTPLDKEPVVHPRAVRCNLDRELPDLDRHDAAWCAGVLEYVRDVPRVTKWLAGVAPVVVCSYAFRPGFTYCDQQAAFLAAWRGAGYRVAASIALPESQRAYRFEREAQ